MIKVNTFIMFIVLHIKTAKDMIWNFWERKKPRTKLDFAGGMEYVRMILISQEIIV
jgi:hypothetical protein